MPYLTITNIFFQKSGHLKGCNSCTQKSSRMDSVYLYIINIMQQFKIKYTFPCSHYAHKIFEITQIIGELY